jgi:putative transposase
MPNDRSDLPNRVSYRRPGWNYASAGWYFITFCTKNRVCDLGEVVIGGAGNAEVKLSQSGKIVLSELMETFVQRPNIAVDEYVIMPNHVHILFEIHDDTGAAPGASGQFTANSISVAVAQLKSLATKRIRSEINPNFAWLGRFYDVVVRDEASLERIREYIRNNPREWHRDRNNQSGVYM